MKYTPGPWNIKGPAKGKWDVTGDYAILDAEGKIIAEVYKTVAYGDLRPAEANARLIAAAPDLLEACKKARQFIENGVEGGYIRLPDKPDPALETLPLICAAIVKAEVKE